MSSDKYAAFVKRMVKKRKKKEWEKRRKTKAGRE